MPGVSWALLDPGVLLGHGGKVLSRLLPARVTQGCRSAEPQAGCEVQIWASHLSFLGLRPLVSISKVKLKHTHIQSTPFPPVLPHFLWPSLQHQ